MTPAPMESSAFKVGDALSYDPVAATFDHWTDRFSSELADRLLALAGPRLADRVLDVGTGTGVVALRVAERLSSGGVCGVDLSAGMLEVAQANAARRGLDARIGLGRMDVERLGVASGAFDVVVSLFALLHFPDPLLALGEMYRVLRPGGRLVLGVGSGPPWFSWNGWRSRLARVPELLRSARGVDLVAPRCLDALVERRVPRSSAAEESHLAATHANRSGVVPALVRRAGFVEVRSRWHGTTAVLETAEAFWELQATFSSIARKRLAVAPPATVASVRAEFLDACRERQRRGGRLLFPHAALFVAGRSRVPGEER